MNFLNCSLAVVLTFFAYFANAMNQDSLPYERQPFENQSMAKLKHLSYHQELYIASIAQIIQNNALTVDSEEGLPLFHLKNSAEKGELRKKKDKTVYIDLVTLAAYITAAQLASVPTSTQKHLISLLDKHSGGKRELYLEQFNLFLLAFTKSHVKTGNRNKNPLSPQQIERLYTQEVLIDLSQDPLYSFQLFLSVKKIQNQLTPNLIRIWFKAIRSHLYPYYLYLSPSNEEGFSPAQFAKKMVRIAAKEERPANETINTMAEIYTFVNDALIKMAPKPEKSEIHKSEILEIVSEPEHLQALMDYAQQNFDPKKGPAEFFVEDKDQKSEVYKTHTTFMDFLSQIYISPANRTNKKNASTNFLKIGNFDHKELAKVIRRYVERAKPSLSQLKKILFYFDNSTNEKIDTIVQNLPSALQIQMIYAEIEQMEASEDILNGFKRIEDIYELNKALEAEGIEPMESSFNFLLLGSPGSGKTWVSHLLVKFLRHKEMIPKKSEPIFLESTQLIVPNGGTAHMTTEMLDMGKGSIIVIENLHLLANSPDEAKTCLDTIESWSRDNAETPIIITGNEGPVQSLLRRHGTFNNLFPNVMRLKSFSPEQLLGVLRSLCESHRVSLTASFEECALREFKREKTLRPENFGSTNDAKSLMAEAQKLKASNLRSRIARQGEKGPSPISKEELTLFRSKDFPKWYGIIDETALAHAMAELNGLIGMQNVKDYFTNLVDHAREQLMRYKEGISDTGVAMNIVFMGKPGTGKTTVARIAGKIYKALGLLKSGDFIEASRTDFVAGYIGHSAILTEATMYNAMHKVLFLDEAYNLVAGEKDFGPEALAAIVQSLSTHEGNIAFIMAGYQDKMRKLLAVNEGLPSRMKNTIHFEDYSPEELWSIFVKLLDTHHYKIADADFEHAKEIVLNIFKREKNITEEKFGNARFAGNLFDELIKIKAKRRSDDLISFERNDFVNLDLHYTKEHKNSLF